MKNKWLSGPYLFWMVIFIVIPMFLILYYGQTKTVDGSVVFSLDNFKRLFEQSQNANALGIRKYPYIYITLKSVAIAAIATVICFALGYPVAYILASRDYSKKTMLLFLFAVPMWMNFVLRMYGWLTLLEDNGVINSILDFLGFSKVNLLYTDGAVLLGMVYSFLPFMILPIYTVLKKMDYSLIEAAQDLGANPLAVFARIVFPLSIPGIVSGVTMVFMPAVTTFFISNLMGGSDYILIGNLIERQFLHNFDWNFGSALSLVLMVIILLSIGIFSLVDKENEGGGLI